MLLRFLSITVFALSLNASVAPAWSEVVWQDGRPIFRSDRQTYRLRSASPVRRQYPKLLSGGPRPYIAPRQPPIIAFPNKEPVGTVIIDASARTLYVTKSDHDAFRYPISVGRQGFTWTGTEQVSRIADWPDWHPPKEMRERQPSLPEKMLGGLRNPLGAKAIYLGNSLYRIHGTNDARTIGQAASSGCFRMLNAHVVHLAGLVKIGTTVKVVDRWPTGGGVARTNTKKTRPDNG